jgi:hypothetical protein
MRRTNWIGCIVGAVVIVFSASGSAQAQTATFSRIDDAQGSRFIDPATTRVDTVDRNKLVIGFHKGLDSATLKYREFRASTAAYSYTAATDSISFSIKAPAGYYVAKVTYTQRGTGSVLRTGRASGAATWTVADVTNVLGTFTTNPALTRTVDLTTRRLTVVPVTINNSLHAFATPTQGSAVVQITGADVKVVLARLP